MFYAVYPLFIALAVVAVTMFIRRILGKKLGRDYIYKVAFAVLGLTIIFYITYGIYIFSQDTT